MRANIKKQKQKKKTLFNDVYVLNVVNTDIQILQSCNYPKILNEEDKQAAKPKEC